MKIHILLLSMLGLILLPWKSSAADFSAERAGTWSTFKQYYIEAYKSYPAYGLVFDPSISNSQANDSGDHAVSEGIGYGMLMAVVQNDQATFDLIFAAAEREMWNGKSYDWKISTSGAVTGANAATDADEDIAYALILADGLQREGKWKATDTYGRKAQVLINNIFDYMTVNGYLKPGDVFGGPQELNLSYFAPAYYRVFDSYETTPHDWKKVIDKQYEILLSVAKKYNGLVPDWSDEFGNATGGRPWKMTYDAIRTPWRIAMDALWFGDARAKQYLNLVMPTVLSKGGVTQVKMYEMNGTAIEWHNELSVAMWAAGGVGSDISAGDKQALVDELKKMYSTQWKYFTNQWEPAKWYYFNQSLSILGAAVIDGSLNKPGELQIEVEETVTGGESGDSSESSQGTVVPKTKTVTKKGKIDGRRVVVKVKRLGKKYAVTMSELRGVGAQQVKTAFYKSSIRQTRN